MDLLSNVDADVYTWRIHYWYCQRIRFCLDGWTWRAGPKPDSAGDGDPDTFHIKIWWEDNGTEYVVYDNGMDQSIGAGSIVVHKK